MLKEFFVDDGKLINGLLSEGEFIKVGENECRLSETRTASV